MGDRMRLVQNDGTITEWGADREGNIRLASRQSLENGQEILKVEENGTLTPLYTCGLEGTCELLEFHANGQQVYLKTNKGVDVEYLVAEDEGHGFRKEMNALAMTAALERFFAIHLGGRYQAEMSAELEAQLEALTVDIDTVE